jgi:multiple sugar transport system substrate-binding protein
MQSKMRARASMRLGALIAAVSLVAAATGAVASSASAKTSKVTISVASLIPGSSAAATTQFNNQVKEFEKLYPSIHVISTPYDWTGPTFAAKLAAHTLPTVFTVPFTDGRSLGEAGQLSNLTKYVEQYSWYKEFNPAVIAEGIDAKNQVIAIPEAAYAQALTYNRQLFGEAGLNPDRPPTTWAQLEADAKQITAKTGVAGFSVMGANDNTAGWILTTIATAFGGRMETGIGTKAKATFDNTGAVDALNFINKLRWTDNVLGTNFGLSWGTSNQAFAAGQIAMFISGSDVYTNMVQADNLNPSIYGLAPIPQQGKNAGVLGGGTLAAVKPDISAAEVQAAVDWINWFYIEPLVSKSAAIRNAKSLIANQQPVGVPELPIFNQKEYDLSQEWIAPYINVPTSQFEPFNNGIFKDKLVPEPESATQAVYGDLDSVVEAVLSQQGSNIPSLLQGANSVGQSSIAQAASTS